MLYINENEKNYIKSLYYTKNINEQGSADSPRSFMNPTQYSGYNEKEAKELIDTYNNVITRYDLTTSDGKHNLLDDAELATAFATAGTGDVYIGTLHSLYWFYEGVMDSVQESRIKKFILGVVELVLAIPGLSKLRWLDRWKNTIKNSPITQTIEKLSKHLTPLLGKIRTYFLQAISSLRKLDDFLIKQNLQFLSKMCKKIISSINNIKLGFEDMVEYLTGSLLKNTQATFKTYVDQNKDDNAVNFVDKAIKYTKPIKGTQYVNKNTQTATQDTTDPRYYQPKTMPTQDTTDPRYYKPKTMPTTLNYK